MLSSSGFLASSFMGWPSIFYISGCAGGLWVVLWMFFGSNSPADYKYITIEEKEFIHSSLGSSDEDKENEQKKHLKTPWGAIFTSMPFYAIVFVHSGRNLQGTSINRYMYRFHRVTVLCVLIFAPVAISERSYFYAEKYILFDIRQSPRYAPNCYAQTLKCVTSTENSM